jgi:cell division protein FtsN
VVALAVTGCGGGKNEAENQQSTEMVPAVVQQAPADAVTETLQSYTREAQIPESVTEPGTITTETVPPQASKPDVTVDQPSAPAEVMPPPAQSASPAREKLSVTGYHGPYCLQVGSFQTTARAERRAAELEASGYSVTIVPALVHGTQYYRVYLPNLPSEADAERLGENLRQNFGFEYLVRKID